MKLGEGEERRLESANDTYLRDNPIPAAVAKQIPHDRFHLSSVEWDHAAIHHLNEIPLLRVVFHSQIPERLSSRLLRQVENAMNPVQFAMH